MNKKEQLHIRLSEKDVHALDKLCNVSRCNKSQVIRMLIHGTKISEPPPVDYYKFLTAMNKVGANLNQIARIANAANVIDKLAYEENVKIILQLLSEIKGAVEGTASEALAEKLLDGYALESDSEISDDFAIPDEF